MRQHYKLDLTFFVGASLFIFSNCTVIGFTTGAIADSSNPMVVEDPVEELLDIPKSSRIQVFLKNGETRKGRFVMCVTDQDDMDKIKYLSMTEKSVETTLPIEVIDHVAILKTPNRKKYIGLGVGIFIDAVILVAAILASGAAGG